MVLSSSVYEIPQWGNVTLFELIWTVVGAVTVLFVLAMLHQVYLGFCATQKGTLERQSAWSYVRRELVRLFQGGCILGVGIYSDVLANPLPGHAFITLTGIIIIAAIFGIALGVVGQSFLDWKARRSLIYEIDKGKGDA